MPLIDAASPARVRDDDLIRTVRLEARSYLGVAITLAGVALNLGMKWRRQRSST